MKTLTVLWAIAVLWLLFGILVQLSDLNGGSGLF